MCYIYLGMHYIKLLALMQSNYIIKKQTLFTASSISIVGLQNADMLTLSL